MNEEEINILREKYGIYPHTYQQGTVGGQSSRVGTLPEKLVTALEEKLRIKSQYVSTQADKIMDLASERDLLLEHYHATRQVREAIAALQVPLETLAKHAGRCAATEICSDHENMQKLAVALHRHLRDILPPSLELESEDA